jgi:NADH:ubiquinone reductase (non-electrogenic)
MKLQAKRTRSLGDCSATKYAPTAQVASQQGAYLARLFNTMARTNALETDIASLKAGPATPERQEALARKQKELSRVKLMKPFEYSHQGSSNSIRRADYHLGSLAYIGSDKAIADLPFGFSGGNVAAGGQMTYYFWRSAYLSRLFSLRNRTLGTSSSVQSR